MLKRILCRLGWHQGLPIHVTLGVSRRWHPFAPLPPIVQFVKCGLCGRVHEEL